jgi:hypothetical protein
MGCDIHCYAEIKNSRGKYEKVANKFINAYYDPDSKFEWNKEKYTDEPICLRNYELFAILADVRNGYGFAGCDTGDGFNIISEPKGIPSDVSNEIREKSDSLDCDGHSHSYLTVDEILNFDWNQTSTLRGFVNLEQYKKYKETGAVYDYCGYVSGNSVEHIDIDQMDEFIKNPPNDDKQYYAQLEWEESYRDCIPNIFFDNISILRELGGDDARLVFWFDN